MMRLILQRKRAANVAAKDAANVAMASPAFGLLRLLLPMLSGLLWLSAFALVVGFGVVARAAEDGANNASDDAPVVVAAFGDSLTSGYGLASPEVDGFAPQLQKQLNLLGLNATVINAGQAGDTSADGLNRVDWVLEAKPDIVVVELGANDMLRFFPVAPMRDNLDAIITKIKQSGAKVLLAGMYATPNHGEEYQEQFRNAYAELATKHDILLYPFFLEGVFGNAAFYNPADEKHPNAKGIKQIATNIAPRIIKALNRP